MNEEREFAGRRFNSSCQAAGNFRASLARTGFLNAWSLLLGAALCMTSLAAQAAEYTVSGRLSQQGRPF